MTLKVKLIFAILIINFGSGDSVCQPKERLLNIFPSKIPNYSYATTEDGYLVDWIGAVSPRDMAGCLEEVTLYYNGRPDTECCSGYQEVTKKPSYGDLTPFMIPELCGNETTSAVFIRFKTKDQIQTSPKLTLTYLRACPKVKKSLFEENKDLLIPFIICGLLLATIIVLCCVMYQLKKGKNDQDDEESRPRSRSRSRSRSSGKSSRSRRSR